MCCLCRRCGALLDEGAPLLEKANVKINRPQGRVEQRKSYSGKKKAHVMKNQVAVYRRPRDGRPIIAGVSPSHEGKAHDKKIYDEPRMTAPSQANA